MISPLPAWIGSQTRLRSFFLEISGFLFSPKRKLPKTAVSFLSKHGFFETINPPKQHPARTTELMNYNKK
jgi:hypothetical protein